mmetsp:Transcript_2104/g.6964  ORF Transcript_2104/g.6964 Transcript_2104/m.6964 type:complete len:280 (-) Transcript_2104:1570-2409(-)
MFTLCRPKRGVLYRLPRPSMGIPIPSIAWSRSALRAIARNEPGTDMTPEKIQQTLENAAGSLESVVLKRFQRGQRESRSRVRHEVTTDEMIVQLEAAQKRKENDPVKKQRARDSLERRLQYVEELQGKMERGELLEHPLTILNLTNVIKALFHQKNANKDVHRAHRGVTSNPSSKKLGRNYWSSNNKASVQALSNASAARAHKPGRRVTRARARARATTTATVRMLTTMTPRTKKNCKREYHFWQRYAFPEQSQVTLSCASGCEGSNRCCAALKARQRE